MPHPFTVLNNQSLKSHLNDQERQALDRARTRFRIFSYVGGVAGAGLGYYLTRRNKSLAMRGLMIFFNGAFLSSVCSGYSSISSMRELSDPQRYPHINAAMRDIRDEILRSRGVDPQHPELGRSGTVPHKPDFKHLPPSTVGNEEPAGANEFYTDTGLQNGEAYAQDVQQGFGNPGLQGIARDGNIGGRGMNGGNQDSAWDAIRKANSDPKNAWDRVRAQNARQQAQPHDNTARQYEDAWNQIGHSNAGDGFGSSIGNDDRLSGSMLSSDDFPRSREDFERASRVSGDRYSSGSAFSA
ncbi:hypothetical protein GGI15_002429 [Coemansia interrupta]|uniref:Uncharacterized protein n=1 Tax=Coemansia interrupta TaxID=1126814 RepID=A0A9W8HF76_9FUNG|nr:hypothetical protein GGI15_002429 [Coemansia interrupta]